MQDTHLRSIAKGISWRFNATFITTVISYALTGEITVALSIGALEFIIKVFWYYLHERIWIAIPFGRKASAGS
ncbi:MAG: hypothetical protein TR69_WS6001000848 [candidate division WS6 bacterium OLB20]|uniref:DUF2061 domain-containing protein n=1 Tax=candidate division WS6 bacterium OLB20 TaxID=1617426 RepID=A0A136LZ05_9BACT|nr:MAG: hypothetical protein TR69_WS6001000848 [candidate division WS6 bacterium OLB20]